MSRRRQHTFSGPGGPVAESIRQFRRLWKPLLAIHVVVSLASVLILTPLYTTLLGWLVLTSGDVALTDEDILRFVVSPRGLLIFIVALAAAITLQVFGLAALLMAAFRGSRQAALDLAGLARNMLGRARPLFWLGLQVVARAALVAAPFLALAWVTVETFLAEFDINYYLAQRPRDLWRALAILVALSVVLVALLFRLFAGWVVALPLLLLENRTPGHALRRSRHLAGPHRGQIARFLLLLAASMSALLGLAGWALDSGAEWLTASSWLSLRAIAWGMAALLLVWTLLNGAMTFVGNCALALGMLQLSLRLSPSVATAWAQRQPAPPRSSGTRLRPWGVMTLLLLALVVTSGWMVDVAAGRVDRSGRTAIIAHRGASAEAPENTLAALELAIRQGADWVEVDVQEAGDGAIVVVHDADLMRLGGSPLRVHDASFEQLRAIDIGSWFGAGFGAERVPSLSQVLDAARGRAGVLIELKYHGRERNLEPTVARLVEEAGMQDQVMIMSLSLPGVRKMKALRPRWPVGLLSTVAVGDPARLEADFLAINARLAGQRTMARARKQGKQIMVWTVNEPALMSAMMGRQVAGIITDRPAVAAAVRAQREQLELHELFIVYVAGMLGGGVDLSQ